MKKLIFIFSIIALFAGNSFSQAVGTGFAQRGQNIPGLTFDGEGIVIGAPADSLIIEIPTSIEAALLIEIMVTTGITSSGPIDVTVANTTAGGETAVQSQITHDTNALTGDLIGVRGNARVNIDSPSGSAIGGKFQAGNSTAGFNMSAVRGVYSEIVNKIPSGAKTWDFARALELNLDLNQGSAGNTTTFGEASGIYMVWNLPTAGTYTTVTDGYGIFMRNEQVGGNGQMLDAALYVDDLNMGGGVKGWDYGVDFDAIEAGFGTADFRLNYGALMNNSTADLLTITEATVDIDGASTASSYTSDADITATNDVIGDSLRGTTGIRVPTILLDMTQNYLITNRSTSMVWQAQTDDTGANIEMYTKKGDNGDNVIFTMWGTGLPASIDNRERLIFGYIATNTQYEIQSEAAGTGTVRPLALYTGTNTNQLALETDGDIVMEAGDLTIGVAGSSEITPTLSIIGDADSDAEDTDETFAVTITPASDPTDAVIAFTSSQGAGYTFDKTITHLAAPVFASYTRHHDLGIGAAILGPNAPTPITIGTSRGLGFNADNEAAYVEVEVPSEWNGSSNMSFNIHWHGENGDAVANTEKVKWDIHYRSVAVGEAVDNGTLVTATTTFTGGASEGDKETYKTVVTIVYTGGNQPLTIGDQLYFQIDRDVTGEAGGGGGYSGEAIITMVELEYTAIALASH